MAGAEQHRGMEQVADGDLAVVVVALGRAGIVLPAEDLAFLAGQMGMLRRTVAAVREAVG